ncbi:MAG: sugar phosphate nucleotidyltransferase [Planctomycetota bacterium]|nr:sugar phosphate nucleotidyltransferase [Planctomycetota bacterium]
MLHAVIMAGGSGTRFWPASRATWPKQLLDLAGPQTMLQATVERLNGLVPPERIMVVTNRTLVAAVAEQLPHLPPRALVGEPCKRDTAPCVGLAAAMLLRDDPEAVMAVMPADHVIPTPDKFRAAISYAAALVAQDPARLITFGIKPSYAAESFGYIECGEAIPGFSAPDAGRTDTPPLTCRVSRFREKPSADIAREYLASGNCCWNSGIFVWKAATILAALRRFEPELCRHLDAIVEALGSESLADVFDSEFAAIRAQSIDYAVMERYENVVVIEAPFDWDDVGSWRSLVRLCGEDKNENTIVGKHLGIRTTGSIVRTDDQHLIVTLGLQDCIVIHTPDATLVANKYDEEAIRQVVKALQEQGWTEYL